MSDRVQRLKDARAEATKEIEEYKQAKEHEFRAFESSVRQFASVVIWLAHQLVISSTLARRLARKRLSIKRLRLNFNRSLSHIPRPKMQL